MKNHLLQNAEKILTAIYNSTHSIRLFVAPDRSIMFFNKKATEIVDGLELKTGDNFMDYFHQGFNEIDCDFENNFTAALQGNYMVIEKEATLCSLWYKIEYYPVYSGDDLLGISISARNITDKVKNKMFLAQQDRALNDIIYFESHEVRSPVASILGLIGILDKSRLCEENRKIIGMLEKATQRLDHITKVIVGRCVNSYSEQIEKRTVVLF